MAAAGDWTEFDLPRGRSVLFTCPALNLIEAFYLQKYNLTSSVTMAKMIRSADRLRPPRRPMLRDLVDKDQLPSGFSHYIDRHAYGTKELAR
jgi:hypothetical protein